MSPYEIDLMLHFHTSPLKPDVIDSLLLVDTLRRFQQDGLLQPRTMFRSNGEGDSDLEITDKGHAFVMAVLSVPLPRKTWIVERSETRLETVDPLG